VLNLKDLHQYQKDIANFILKKSGAFVIAEMGLGKTVSALSAIQYLQKEKGFKSALILAPLRVVYNSWPDEIDKWKHLTGTKYHIIHGKGKMPFLPKVPLYFSNYESLPYIIDKKLHKPCDILVIDESSMIKNHKTKRFKMLKKISKCFKKIILLTGTPSPSGQLTELFSQTFMLDQGKRLGTSFWSFQRRYYESDFMGYNWELRPGSRKEIENKVKDICIVLKAKDYLELPDCIHNSIMVDLPKKVKAQYIELEKEFLLQIQDDVVTAANAAVLSSKLRQVTAGGIYHEDGKEYTLLHQEKIEALKEIIDGTDDNILCAFQFKLERSLLTRNFPGVKFIDGSTSAAESNKAIKAWNNKKIKLLCVHPQSVGHGLNLQSGGHTLVWLSPDWSLERTLQMNARVFRQGQKQKVFIHTIACKNTVDLAVIEALQNKSQGQRATINALKQYIKGKV
jgi:SNF2 family DNA or RNA helicase